MADDKSEIAWLGWAIDRPGLPLYVQYGGDEEEAWRIALGWPSPEEIAHSKSIGARAFRVQITVIPGGSAQ